MACIPAPQHGMYIYQYHSMVCMRALNMMDKHSLSCSYPPQLAQRLRGELHQRLEREIQQLQDGLDRDEDDAHFRELDAEQLRHSLRTLPLRLHH